MEMKSLLRKYRSDIALVIGNGINLYGPASRTNSWHDLLVKLAGKHLPAKLRSIPDGVALTEFYDVLELTSTKSVSGVSLQQEFCDLMASWQYYEHHQRIVEWAQKADAPILTTNFGESFLMPGNAHCNGLRTADSLTITRGKTISARSKLLTRVKNSGSGM